jgi:AraC-like DNA-binding protein
VDVLADILTVTRLAGNVACHTWCDPPWGIRFDPAPKVWFHIVAAGGARLATTSTKRDRPIALGPHDIVLLPHGAGHVLCDDMKSTAMPLAEWRARPKREARRPDGARTELVCGSYTIAFAEIHPVLRLLPEVIHVPGGAVREHPGMQSSLDLLLRELTRRDVGGERVVSRLLEVMFVLVLRHWLDVAGGGATGWLGALRDEPIGRALVELHTSPARDWTIAALAREVGMSRPVLARRFAEKVGETPLGYLRKLRIDLASVLLVETDRSLAEIGAAVGYTSEFAFNRAFQRARGVPPGRYRQVRRAGTAPDGAAGAPPGPLGRYAAPDVVPP